MNRHRNLGLFALAVGALLGLLTDCGNGKGAVSVPSDEAALKIDSEPPGATVYLDRKPLGETPLFTQGLTPGERYLILEYPGFNPLRTPVSLTAGHVAERRYRLEPGIARISILRAPPGAVVRLDDRDLSGTAPFTTDWFNAGPHLLTVSLPGRSVRIETISLLAWETRRLAFDDLGRLSEEPEPGALWTEPATGMEFSWVPGGCFAMGCYPGSGECDADEKPVHEICLDGYWMGRREVSQSEWLKVMATNPSSFPKGGAYPVERVSWEETQAFIDRLNKLSQGVEKSRFRLPTEAEWEYACRGGGRDEVFSGSDVLEDVAWVGGNRADGPHVGGKKGANALGLYDMSGNLWEWVLDTYHAGAYREMAFKNPVVDAPGLYRVMRGGAWTNYLRNARCGYRYRFIPSWSAEDIGFRLVREGFSLAPKDAQRMEAAKDVKRHDFPVERMPERYLDKRDDFG